MPYSTERGSSHSPTSAPSWTQRSIARRTASATPGEIPSASFSSFATPTRRPFRSSASGSSTGGTSTVVESQSSRPLMIPYRETVPYVGRRPTLPQSADGCLIEPPVSEPSAHGASPADTAAADPPPEPPGTRVGSHGLCEGPNAEFSVDEPIANSSVLVLPSSVNPASLTRAATVESKTGT